MWRNAQDVNSSAANSEACDMGVQLPGAELFLIASTNSSEAGFICRPCRPVAGRTSLDGAGVWEAFECIDHQGSFHYGMAV